MDSGHATTRLTCVLAENRALILSSMHRQMPLWKPHRGYRCTQWAVQSWGYCAFSGLLEDNWGLIGCGASADTLTCLCTTSPLLYPCKHANFPGNVVLTLELIYQCDSIKDVAKKKVLACSIGASIHGRNSCSEPPPNTQARLHGAGALVNRIVNYHLTRTYTRQLKLWFEHTRKHNSVKRKLKYEPLFQHSYHNNLSSAMYREVLAWVGYLRKQCPDGTRRAIAFHS